MKYQRKYLRAPVLKEAFFNVEGESYTVKVFNISEGGLSLLAPQFFKSSNPCYMMLYLDEPVDLAKEVASLYQKQTSPIFLRLEGFLLPQVRQASQAGYELGFEFSEIDFHGIHSIKKYVEMAKKNLSYLLSLETAGNDECEGLKKRVIERLGWFDQKSDMKKQLFQYQKSLNWPNL